MSETHEDRLPGAPASSADGIVSDLAKVLSSARNADMSEQESAGSALLRQLRDRVGVQGFGDVPDEAHCPADPECVHCGHPVQLASGLRHWRHSDQGGTMHCIVAGVVRADLVATPAEGVS